MISLTELSTDIEPLAGLEPYASIQEAETALVHEGTPTTKALFDATILLLEEATEYTSLSHPKKQLVFNGFLSRMVNNHVIIATDSGSEEPDEVKAAALYTMFEDDKPLVQLDRIAVVPRLQHQPERRGAGYGSMILEHIEQYTAAQGAERIWLYADLFAMPFYFKHDYKLGSDMKLYKDLQLSEAVS